MRLVSLIILFILSACNSQVADLTPIRMTPIRITTSNEGTFTQMMIFATNPDGSFAFARRFTSAPVIEQEVPIGQYRIYGMTFNAMTSERCAKVERPLSGLSNEVTLNFTEDACANPDFLGEDPDLNLTAPGSVTFSFTSVELCDALSNLTDFHDACTDDLNDPLRKNSRGHAMSVRITLSQYEKVRGQKTVSPGLTWGCQSTAPTGTSVRGLANNGVSNFAPAGDGSTTPFHMRFEFYFRDNCAGTPYIVDLDHGLVTNTSKVKHVLTPGLPAMRKLFFKIGKEEVCQGENLTQTFATGDGPISRPYIICNETQFYNILPNSTIAGDYTARASQSYKLFTDIDLSDNSGTGGGDFNPAWESCVQSGSNFMPIGFTYNGASCGNTSLANVHFDGNGHTIKGLKIYNGQNLATGLYSILNSGSNIIQRLTLEDSEVSGQNNTGSLVGYGVDATVRNLNLKNAIVHGPTSDYVGGLAGRADSSTVENVSITGLSVSGRSYVGGLFGSTNLNSIPTDITRAFVSGSISAYSYVGGLVGISNGAGFGSLAKISKSKFAGTITTAQLFTGGIIGFGYTTRIENSYAQAFLINTYLGSPMMGGIAGYMSDDTAANEAGVFSSITSLTITDACPNTPVTLCYIGEIIGNHDGSFGDSNFDTAVFPANEELGTTPALRGSKQPDFSFLSANPDWRRADNTSIMSFFLPTVWQFSNTAVPKLVDEPTP